MNTITVDNIIKSLNECLALIDFNGRIIDANAPLAKLLGVKQKQLIGEYAVNFWRKDKLNQIKEGIDHTKKYGKTENQTGVLITKKNNEISVSFNSFLMKDTKDKPYAVLVIIKDLRKLKKNVDVLKDSKNILKDKILKKKQDMIELNHKLSETNKQLKLSENTLKILFKQIKETQRLKAIFLSSLSEEFYSPILSILGFAEILKEKASKSAENEKTFLKDIKNYSYYLLEILENLDDLLKVEKNNMDLKMQKTDLFVVYSGLKNIYQNILEFNKKVELELVFPYEPLPEVLTDRAKLKLIMINLINTAIANVKEGKIFVKVVPSFSENLVTTKIESEYATHEHDDVLFDRFSELFKINKNKGGLGLEKTKEIIEKLGGNFNFESREDGKIVIASFTLPFFDARKKQQKMEISEQ